MAVSRYYIVDRDDLNLTDILNVCLEEESTLRENVAKTKCVVKMYDHLTEPAVLTAYGSMTHSEIKTEMAKPEWTPEEEII